MDVPSLNRGRLNNSCTTIRVKSFIAMDGLDVKVVILGNRGVGKTCIAKRYVEGAFSLESKTTIAAAFMTKRL